MHFLGPLPTIRQTTIVEIAARENPENLAESLRIEIARLALDNPDWAESYRRMLESMTDNALFHLEVCFVDEDLRSAPSRVVLESGDTTLDRALGVFDHARRIFAIDHATEDQCDLVASVVAAEMWMTALDRSCFGSAAASGPDAVSAAAAIIARFAGQPVNTMPVDPEWPTMVRPLQAVAAAERHCREWVETHFGPFMWMDVAPLVANDLSWGAESSSKTHEAALLVGARFLYDFV